MHNRTIILDLQAHDVLAGGPYTAAELRQWIGHDLGKVQTFQPGSGQGPIAVALNAAHDQIVQGFMNGRETVNDPALILVGVRVLGMYDITLRCSLVFWTGPKKEPQPAKRKTVPIPDHMTPVQKVAYGDGVSDRLAGADMWAQGLYIDDDLQAAYNLGWAAAT